MDGKWVDSRSRWVDKWYGMDNSRVMSRKVEGGAWVNVKTFRFDLFCRVQ